MKYRLISSILFLFLCLFELHAQSFERFQNRDKGKDILPLAGIWKFKLDPFFTGVGSNGVQLMPRLPEEIILPGSTDQAGKGYKTHGMTSLRLTRLFEYKGPAWYEKEVFVPITWKDKAIELFLERAHWETQVWINGKPVGKRESLSAPHIYTVTSLIQPGEMNAIRIRVDNSTIYDIPYTHAKSAETQTNWNGIIGEIQLRASDKIHFTDIQVYPKAEQKLAQVKMKIANLAKVPVKGTINFSGNSKNTTNLQTIPTSEFNFSGSDSIIALTVEVPLGEQVQLWDEFNPTLYDLAVEMTAKVAGRINKDVQTVTFGVRELSTDGTQFILNGRPTFIRATVNCASFPITGYPPTDIASWKHIFQTCKDYGLNAMRFHSWCPPEAAFDAADALGVYLQVENSDWRFTVGEDSATNKFLKEEADRILKTYGNHPSFVMFAEGNELVGPTVKPFLSGLVSDWKKKDPRHLYTGSSAYPIVPENQFNVLYGARPQRWKEGLKGRFNVRPLNTLYDYSDYVTKHVVPMITHEVGQWCVFPNFNELSKYTGVLKPYNYQLFRELLRNNHMLDQAKAFTMASGKFQVIQKKEEIESYLRTPGFGGYHLLQLNDFPGQGTSPVGVVDIFWDPKPYVTAEAFSQFQAARVPLLRTASFTWTNDQIFNARAEFANYGSTELRNAIVQWSLNYPDGTAYAEGTFDQARIPIGSPIKLGEISVSLENVKKATSLDLTIRIKGTDYANHWNIWVYPKQLPSPKLKDVMVAKAWTKRVEGHLKKGGKVLLLPDTAAIASDADPVFSGISWNTVWSGMPPNLLGILCNPEAPALKNFPTDYHSDWQWWDITRHSKPMVLDHMPIGLKPLIQMIPDWNRPRKLSLAFEAKVGKGKLLVCAVDLRNNMDERPVARQLLYNLKEYAQSDDFKPRVEVTETMVKALFKKQ